MTDPQGGVTSYVFDTLNRLSTLTPPNAFTSGSFGFSYDALSRRTQMTRPNGVTTNYTYNNLSQLLSVLHQVGTSTIDGATYTVDPAGNRTAKTDKYANVTSNYTYDPVYELTQVTQATNTTESYSYDPVGNRLSSLGVSPYNVNSSNELTSTPSATYTYDNNGNTLTKVTSAGTTTYGWDYDNRLTSVTLPGTSGTLAFKYDGLGRRVQKVFTQNSTSTTTNYLYDGYNAVADVDQSGNVLARYIMTQNIDEPLAELRSSTTSYYEADGLGSVTSLSTSAGALSNTYRYDSFGNLTASSGSIANRFQYTAREFDPEIGLYFYRARYYDQTVGRFLSEDPFEFGEGGNFYRYGANNPVNGFDPLGLSFWRCFGRGFVRGVVLTAAVVGTAAAIVAIAPAAAPIVTGTLFIGGAVGLASTGISLILNHSANNVGFNLGALAGSALVGGTAGKALAGLLSPPDLQPPADTPLISSSIRNAWRNPATGNISFPQFIRDFPSAMKTGPDAWGNRGALIGAGAGLANATDCDACN